MHIYHSYIRWQKKTWTGENTDTSDQKKIFQRHGPTWAPKS